jgi:hypothetical protein
MKTATITQLNKKFDSLNNKYVSLCKTQDNSKCEFTQDEISIKLQDIQNQMGEISNKIENL